MRALFCSIFVLSLIAVPAFAEEEDSCSQSCNSGEVLVSFADGNSARCVCQEIGAAMQDSPADEINCVDPEDDGSCE